MLDFHSSWGKQGTLCTRCESLYWLTNNPWLVFGYHVSHLSQFRQCSKWSLFTYCTLIRINNLLMIRLSSWTSIFISCKSKSIFVLKRQCSLNLGWTYFFSQMYSIYIKQDVTPSDSSIMQHCLFIFTTGFWYIWSFWIFLYNFL